MSVGGVDTRESAKRFPAPAYIMGMLGYFHSGQSVRHHEVGASCEEIFEVLLDWRLRNASYRILHGHPIDILTVLP